MQQEISWLEIIITSMCYQNPHVIEYKTTLGCDVNQEAPRTQRYGDFLVDMHFFSSGIPSFL